jgi:branched-chain amino acid transport system permease protein
VSAGEFTINLSITFLVAVVVGGAATIIGPAIGAFLVVYIPIWLDDLGADPQLSPVLFGASLIALMMVAPGGIVGLYRRVTGWLSRRVGARGGEPPPRAAPDALASAS